MKKLRIDFSAVLRGLLALLAAGCMTGSLRADLLSEVPKANRSQLQRQETVIISTPVPGTPWPKLKLYRVINAPVATLWRMLTDYEAQPSYMPGTLSAKVLARNPDGTVNVQYTIKAPVILQMTYTVQDRYSHQGNLSKVTWKLLKSPLAKSSDGSIAVEPYGNKQSLLCYTNHTVPIISFITGLQNQALDTAQKTVDAIATEAARRTKGATAR